MKKILFSLAAVAAMVGCAKDAPIVDNTNNTPEETLAISASIDLSDTRVTIGGEKFTEVEWERGDSVRLVSLEKVNTVLITTESGDTDVRFFNDDAEYKADVDTYYAIYPSTDITNGVVSFDLTTQNGKAAKAAVLAATTKEAAKGVIDMAFKPINALLHVAVTGAPTLKTAEFLAFNGDKFASSFSYDFATETVTLSDATTTVLTVDKPDAKGFFFSLPAGLEMANGYIVRLTDTNNNVCSKAYSGSTINGTTFKQGTTTRVEFEWTQPTVTLGTPMTSYSYYAAGEAATANDCANNLIYFPNASTYANVQNAMVTEAGVVVDGTDYAADFANKSFTPAEVTVSSWGEHTVKAYIETKDGKRYESAPQTVHITGLPYNANWFNSEDTTGWATTGTVKFNDKGNGYRTFKFYALSKWTIITNETGAIFSPSLNLPANVNIHYDIKACYHTASYTGDPNNLITGITSGTTVPQSTQTKSVNHISSTLAPKEDKYTTCSFDATIGNGQRVYISDSHTQHKSAAENWFVVGSCYIGYR